MMDAVVLHEPPRDDSGAASWISISNFMSFGVGRANCQRQLLIPAARSEIMRTLLRKVSAFAGPANWSA